LGLSYIASLSKAITSFFIIVILLLITEARGATEEDITIIKKVISKAGREIGISPEIIALWKKDFEL
jgi:hypothetical protein